LSAATDQLGATDGMLRRPDNLMLQKILREPSSAIIKKYR
jgi:hypothetical protein